uniref:Aromatic-L-amino-acid decarboxylase n=1 Tax=Aegilops tauschii TaxID=37682 RepID=M8BMV1_AEGTA
MATIPARSGLVPAFGERPPFHPLNDDDVRSYLHKAVDFISDYYKSVESMPVLPSVKPGYLRDELGASPPVHPAPFDVAMKELRASVVPGITHWASPNFFAFFPATNSAAAIAGDLIASAMNTVGFTRPRETAPEYLKNDASVSGDVTDLKDMQVGVGRRFRGLKLWMVMRTYGTANLQEHIRRDVAMAKMFEDLVHADNRFEIVVPRNFALVCFRIKAAGVRADDEVNRLLMANVNKTGKAYLTHTVVGGKLVLRFAVGSSLQEEKHILSAWELIRKTISDMMK